MSSDGLLLLLQTLEERNIGLGSDDVAWAFESARTRDDAESWVREYLKPACLLTSEEKLLYVCFTSRCPQTLIVPQR